MDLRVFKEEKPQVKRIENKEDYMDMLLEADPSKTSIMKYLNDSDVYGLKLNDEIISLAVILHIDNKTLELKNLVTKSEYKNKGYAKRLLKHLCGNYKQKYSKMIVGTTENNIPFYVKQGFDKYEKTLKNYFIDNYDEEIKDGIVESAVLPLMDMDNDGSGKPIEIYLSTIGGDIYSGFSLVDASEKVKTPTTIHILSMAASMGLLIAMAGHNNPNVKTVCHPFSVGLLHSGSQYMEGTAHAVKDTFDFSQHYEDKIKQYILTHSNITDDLYNKIERKEY